ALSAFVVLQDYAPDPLKVPEPKLFFMFDKTFLSPARVIHFLAVTVAFAGAFAWILAFARPLGRFLSMLGRNSLNVFCMGSILSLLAQIARFSLGGSIMVDIAVLAFGLSALGLTAWLSELRERPRSRSVVLLAPA